MFIKVQYIHLGLVHQKALLFPKKASNQPDYIIKRSGMVQEKFIVSYMRKTELKYA